MDFDRMDKEYIRHLEGEVKQLIKYVRELEIELEQCKRAIKWLEVYSGRKKAREVLFGEGSEPEDDPDPDGV